MRGNNSKRPNGLYKHFRDALDSKQPEVRKNLSLERIAELLSKHPELRLEDDPSVLQLLQMVLADPEDADAQEMLALIIDEKRREAISSGDVFWGNYPPAGSTQYPEDFIGIGMMPTNEPVGVVLSQLQRNTLLVGPTGSGKTTFLKVLLCNRKLLSSVRVVVFVKKRELRDLLTVADLSGLVTIFRMEDPKLAFSQPPPGVKDIVWANELSKIFAQSYGRFSAQRLMNIKLCELMAKRPSDSFPTLQQLVQVLEELRPHFASRENLYKESVLFCLNDLLECTRPIWNYGSSNFLEVLFSSPGLAVIEVETIPQEHLTFLATYFMRWIYCKRLYSGKRP